MVNSPIFEAELNSALHWPRDISSQFGDKIAHYGEHDKPL